MNATRPVTVFLLVLALGAAAWLLPVDHPQAELDARTANLDTPNPVSSKAYTVRRTPERVARDTAGASDSDPAIAACTSELRRLASAGGRRAIREHTSVDAVQRNRRLNPDGRVLSRDEEEALGKLLAAWDKRVEEAHFAEREAHWRATLAALDRGDVRTYQLGQPSTCDEVVRKAARMRETVIDLPGLEDRTGRIVVLERTRSPDYFRLREQHEAVLEQRDEAVRQFLSRR